MRRTIIIILLSILYSCRVDCESEIYIPKLILENARSNFYPYCKNVNLALKGNIGSIKELFTTHYSFASDGESGYAHGFVVLEITRELGEDKVLEIISSFSKEELNIYVSYIEVGLDYESGTKKPLKLKDIFPKIDNFLNEQ
jgi:hypothetical protein